MSEVHKQSCRVEHTSGFTISLSASIIVLEFGTAGGSKKAVSQVFTEMELHDIITRKDYSQKQIYIIKS